jgi:hypothetical protein
MMPRAGAIRTRWRIQVSSLFAADTMSVIKENTA